MLKTPTSLCVSFLLLATIAQADYLDDIGLTDLRARDSSLDGSGVTVAQVETFANAALTQWQTNPAATGLDNSKFNFFEDTSPYPTGTTFSNDQESTHANRVGALFFGIPSGTQGRDGVAPGVDAIELFTASYHPNSIVSPLTSTNAKIINCSFVFNSQDDNTDLVYDNYVSQKNVLFCNGIFTDRNNDPEIATEITSPASSYNCIAVGTIDDVNLTPLADGRSKPDIVAPAPGSFTYYTSYTTPVVSGAATLLYQSGARGDAGNGTEANAVDTRTIKAILLNSATKTDGWSHTSTHPLDVVNGAGVLEINQAHLQLTAGQYSEIENDVLTTSGADHLPPANNSNIISNTGWNLSTLVNQRSLGLRRDATDHYYFKCDSANASTFNLNATLIWNRNLNQSNINNLDLFLYKEDGTLVASSISTVDNVEHLYELNLAPGRYVLSVYKPTSGRVSTSETYALAFNFQEGAPVAADNATATTESSSSLRLDWSDNASNETGFRIERRISGGNYNTLTTIAADTESYTDTTCAPATTYEYQIIAYNDHGDSAAATTNATTYSTQEDWRLLNFGTTDATGDAADDADPETDGLVNQIEFATGNDPNTHDSHPIGLDELGSSRQLSFTWRTNSGLDFSIGYSNDLATGFTYYSSTLINDDLSPHLEFISAAPIDDELDTLTYGIKESVSDDKVFIQLQINTP